MDLTNSTVAPRRMALGNRGRGLKPTATFVGRSATSAIGSQSDRVRVAPGSFWSQNDRMRVAVGFNPRSTHPKTSRVAERRLKSIPQISFVIFNFVAVATNQPSLRDRRNRLAKRPREGRAGILLVAERPHEGRSTHPKTSRVAERRLKSIPQISFVIFDFMPLQ